MSYRCCIASDRRDIDIYDTAKVVFIYNLSAKVCISSLPAIYFCNRRRMCVYVISCLCSCGIYIFSEGLLSCIKVKLRKTKNNIIVSLPKRQVGKRKHSLCLPTYRERRTTAARNGCKWKTAAGMVCLWAVDGQRTRRGGSAQRPGDTQHVGLRRMRVQTWALWQLARGQVRVR